VYDVFLSYASADRARVQPLRDALVAEGLTVFWDLDTPLGENWDAWIRRHLDAAKVVVVLWTPASAASHNVQHEAVIARDAGKLVPALIEPMAAADFPMGFYTTQAAPMAGWGADRSHPAYVKLLWAIRARVPASVDERVVAERLADAERRAAAERALQEAVEKARAEAVTELEREADAAVLEAADRARQEEAAESARVEAVTEHARVEAVMEHARVEAEERPHQQVLALSPSLRPARPGPTPPAGGDGAAHVGRVAAPADLPEPSFNWHNWLAVAAGMLVGVLSALYFLR
jgi:TIR domain